MNPATSITGIPTDLLIIGMASLCAVVGGAMWHELRSLRREANIRGRQIVALRAVVRLVCVKLHIPYSTEDAE